jgi:carbohydrate kinase (thermoresistant glucokinase family)
MGKHVVYVMGVSGSGKSRVGQALADAIGARFLDADSMHPAANIEKMSHGIPLTDEDRWPWLRALAAAARDADGSIVIACSALRRVYRDVLREDVPNPFFVELNGPRALLDERLRARPGHFMPASLLDSQLATLEPLQADESGVVIDIGAPVDEIVASATAALGAPVAD